MYFVKYFWIEKNKWFVHSITFFNECEAAEFVLKHVNEGKVSEYIIYKSEC